MGTEYLVNEVYKLNVHEVLSATETVLGDVW